ncbi:MAG: hypothetical protein KBC81_00615 [Candidatus Pacebacteria bacterium]|nr:hypothetical protein [Candidatus Paceibacterota bacterium]
MVTKVSISINWEDGRPVPSVVLLSAFSVAHKAWSSLERLSGVVKVIKVSFPPRYVDAPAGDYAVHLAAVLNCGSDDLSAIFFVPMAILQKTRNRELTESRLAEKFVAQVREAATDHAGELASKAEHVRWLLDPLV